MQLKKKISATEIFFYITFWIKKKYTLVNKRYSTLPEWILLLWQTNLFSQLTKTIPETWAINLRCKRWPFSGIFWTENFPLLLFGTLLQIVKKNIIPSWGLMRECSCHSHAEKQNKTFHNDPAIAWIECVE